MVRMVVRRPLAFMFFWFQEMFHLDEMHRWVSRDWRGRRSVECMFVVFPDFVKFGEVDFGWAGRRRRRHFLWFPEIMRVKELWYWDALSLTIADVFEC